MMSNLSAQLDFKVNLKIKIFLSLILLMNKLINFYANVMQK